MVTTIIRRLEYHDPFALQQADQAIRKDVVHASVELITNSNDSYYRLETEGNHCKGTIIDKITRKRRNSILSVGDFAVGMSSRTMNEKVGTYAAPTSGFQEGKSVRGLWGRGLKDSFYGLGHGRVISIRNDMLYEARLFIDEGAPMYGPPQDAVHVTKEIWEELQSPKGNSTAGHFGWIDNWAEVLGVLK